LFICADDLGEKRCVMSLIKLVVGSFLIDAEVVVGDARLIDRVSPVVDRGSKESSLHKSV